VAAVVAVVLARPLALVLALVLAHQTNNHKHTTHASCSVLTTAAPSSRAGAYGRSPPCLGPSDFSRFATRETALADEVGRSTLRNGYVCCVILLPVLVLVLWNVLPGELGGCFEFA